MAPLKLRRSALVPSAEQVPPTATTSTPSPTPEPAPILASSPLLRERKAMQAQADHLAERYQLDVKAAQQAEQERQRAAAAEAARQQAALVRWEGCVCWLCVGNARHAWHAFRPAVVLPYEAVAGLST